MVASYSLTQAHRSGALPECLTTVTTGLRSVLARLRSAPIDHGSSYQAFNTQEVLSGTSSIEEQLTPLPSHTFGHQWLTWINQDEYPQTTTPSHPFFSGLHVLTGYGTDPMGQAELQAFLLGATGDVISLWQCAKTVHNLRQYRLVLASSLQKRGMTSRLYQAYQRGRASYFRFEHWHPEQLWDLPLQYVRQWFGITDQAISTVKNMSAQ